jgi:WD40 repeat protein
MNPGLEGAPRQGEDSWIVAIHAGQYDSSPLGSGFLIDGRRALTCAHVVCVKEIPLAELWLAFPKSDTLMDRRVRVKTVLVPPGDRQALEDVAVLELAEDLGSQAAARLRCPEPGRLTNREWWSFGFPGGDPLGNPAAGTIGAGLGYGWIRLDTHSRSDYPVTDGYSGAALWSEGYQAVVGLVGHADKSGDARALTLWQVDRCLPQAKLRHLADWAAEAAGESALAAWGWELTNDPEAGRHWRPRARGVARDSERGFRFRGRRVALTELVSWITSDQPQHSALVVTGSPGVGKSAVLGRIVTCADPQIAAQLPAEDDAVRAPVRSIACAVHAKSKTALDVATEIARAASAPIPQQTGDLALSLHAVLANRPARNFTVVIDALDEAASAKDAREVVRWVVRPLVEDLAEFGVRVLVGSRRRDGAGNLLAAFGAAKVVVDLDAPEYFELEDLEAYSLASLQLLGAERHGNPYQEPAVAGPVAARIAFLAQGNFLVAGLIARSHGLHDQVPVAPEQISFSPKVDDALSEFLERVPAVGQRTAAQLLSVLAYAEAPGFTAGLWHVAVNAVYGGSPGEESLRMFARASAANFLVEDSAGAGDSESGRAYRLFHQALNDVLLTARDETAADERALAHSLLAAGRAAGWHRAPAYLLRSLPRHAERGHAMAELMAEPDYPLYADLRRLIRTAVRSSSTRTQDSTQLRLLRKTQRAIDAAPGVRAALFSVVEAQQRLGTVYRESLLQSPYRAAWAHTEPEEEQSVLEGHIGPVYQVTALPTAGGRFLLASGGHDGTVRLWDPDTGENLRIINGHDGPINTVCMVPRRDRTTLLASGGDDCAVRLWDPETGENLREMEGRSERVAALGAAVAEDGRHLLVAVLGRTMVRAWDQDTGKIVNTLTHGIKGLFSACALGPGDAEVLALGARNGTVHLWNPLTGRLQRVIAGYAGAATAICALPTTDGGRILAVGGDDHTVRLWDCAYGTHLSTLEQEGNPVTAVCAVPQADGRTLVAVANGNRNLQIWTPGDLVSRQSMVADTGMVYSISPVQAADGDTLLATASHDSTVRLWAPHAQADSPRVREKFGRQSSLYMTPDSGGQTLLGSLSSAGDVFMVNPGTGRLVKTVRSRVGTAGIARLVSLSPSPLLIAASTSGSLTMFDVESGNTRWKQESYSNTEKSAKPFLRRHYATVTDMFLFEDGQSASVLVTASTDGTVRVWSVRDGTALQEPKAVRRAVRGVCALRSSSGQTLIAAGGDDCLVRVWPEARIQPTLVMKGHADPVAAVFPVLLPGGGSLLGSLAGDGELRLWDPETGRCRSATRIPGGRVSAVVSLTGKSGRTLLATGGDERVARIWDLDGQAVMQIPARQEITALTAVGNRLVLGLASGIMAVDIDDTAAA